ncbi:MAG: cytochrome d ubiquinol oxidase subunit II [Bacteroidales bacterium]|nr:cytochrome d ubiquinol oxidase subunit II [Bacteroidales bacterium]
MFENLSHLALQQYWWLIIAVLGAILVFMMFVQGGQTLIRQIAGDETERSMLINTIGKKWDLTFTTLVTFGGAFFASFPLFYSTSFGGAYWVWTIILFSFIIQAVSYEFRTKPENFLGQKTYDTFLLINGVLSTILIGAAVGTFFTGSEFSVDKMRIAGGGESNIISQWENTTRGLEAALNITNLALGLSVFFLARILGLLYFMNSIKDESIFEKSRKHLLYNTIPFLVFFLLFVGLILTKDGFAVNPDTKEVFMESFKYLHNLIQMPLLLILFLIGVVLVLNGIFMGFVKKSIYGIWYTGAGTMTTVLVLFLIAGYNNTSFYPSTFDLQSSLTIENSSSSHYTLTAMSYVSLMVPFIIAYIAYAWKSLTNKKIDRQEIETTIDKY